MVNRRETLWKRVMATLLERVAVRVIFVPADAPVDEKVQRALKNGTARPMDPAFFTAIKDFLASSEEKRRLWVEVIRPKSDQMMQALWQRVWRTPEGRAYKEISEEVAKQKARVDQVAKAASDGLTQKILAGGRIVDHIKTRILVGREEMVAEAQAEIERLRGELEQAKARLKDLQRAREDQYERVNLLLVRDVSKAPPKEGRRYPSPWSARRTEDEVAQAIRDLASIDELMLEPLEQVDGALAVFLDLMQGLAGQEADELDLNALDPEPEAVEEPV
jgi:hypothetical protein